MIGHITASRHVDAAPAVIYLEELQRLADLAEGRLRHDPVPQQPGP